MCRFYLVRTESKSDVSASNFDHPHCYHRPSPSRMIYRVVIFESQHCLMKHFPGSTDHRPEASFIVDSRKNKRASPPLSSLSFVSLAV